MANNKVNVKINLDFISNKTSMDQIKKEVQTLKHAIDLSIDPKAAGKLKSDVDTLGRGLTRSLNETTGKVNLKKLSTFLDNNLTTTVKQFSTSLSAAGINGVKSFNAVESAGEFLNKSLTESNSLLTKMGTTLMNTIRWNISASIINKTTQEFQKMYFFAKDLDRSLTNIRIVSGASADNMSRFAKEANKASKELKVSTIDYTEAALIFYQQGLNALEVQNMTRASIIGSNITGESTAEMSNLLTAVLNGYKVATEDVLMVTDKLAAVGASTAADFYELATAMSKVSSMANAAGVPLDQLNAQIATIVSVTREAPESIGMSLKTIYGRMLMFKNNSTTLMEDEDGELFGAPSVEKALQAYSNATGAQISLFKTASDGKQELRDLGEVIEEIGSSWDKTTDKTAKFGLTTALAGSRQQNRLIALFDAWDMYEDAVTTSLEAEGTSMRQNEIYMESYEGRLKGLEAAKQELYMGMIDSSSMKDLISGLTTIVSLFTKIVDLSGNMGAALGIAAALVARPAFMKIGASLTGLGSATSTPGRTKEEIAHFRQLETIKKTFGADEANRVRLNLKNTQDTLKMHKTEHDLLSRKKESYNTVTKALKNQNNTLQQRADIIATEKAINSAMGVTNSQIDSVTDAYTKLNKEVLNLGKLKKEANETGSMEAKKAAEESLSRVRELKKEIQTLNKINAKDHKISNSNVDQAELDAKAARIEARELEKQAIRTERAVSGIQTGMMLILPAIATARDSTKSWGNLMGSIGMMMIPMSHQILKGIGDASKAVKAFTLAQNKIESATTATLATKNATEGVAKAGSKLGAIWATSLGPMLAAAAAAVAIGAVIKIMTDYANQYKDAIAASEEATSRLAEAQTAYDSVKESLKSVKEQLVEIRKLENTSPDMDEEIASLEAKNIELERELKLKEFIRDIEREKAGEAAYDATTTTFTSKYKKSWTSEGVAIGDQVNESEELKAITEEYGKQIQVINKLNDAIGLLDPKNKEQVKDIEKLNVELEKETKYMTEVRADLGKYTNSIGINNEQLNENNLQQKAKKDSNKAILETGYEIIDNEAKLATSLGNSTNELGDNSEAMLDNAAQKKANAEASALLVDNFQQSSDNLSTYNGFLKEMTSQEGLSEKSKQTMIVKYQQFLPFIGDEIELREALIEAIETEEETQREAYAEMLRGSTEFFDEKIKKNAELTNRLNEFYGIDLSNAKSLAEAKQKLEVGLIKRLSKIWGDYYRVAADGTLIGDMSSAAEDQRLKNAGGSGRLLETKLFQIEGAAKQYRDAQKDFEDLFGSVVYQGIDASLKGDKDKGKGGSAGQQKLLDALDAQIRAIKIKNDEIIRTEGLLQKELKAAKELDGIEGLSEEYRVMEKIILNNVQALESFKLEQKLIHDIAVATRAQNKQYDTTTWFDANAQQTEAYIDKYNKSTAKQKEEMEVLFSKIQRLKLAWMESATEIEKISDLNQGLIKDNDKLLAQRKELARTNWIKEQNDLYQQQQDRLSALDKIQEQIVAIIRKRGEVEKAALDLAHTEEMDSLQKRYDLRKKLYADELSDFQAFIQAKIDLLNDQKQEEDYIKALEKEREEANRLQAEIDVLALDDSLTARNKTLTLRKELAAQNEKIAEMQQDKERELAIKSLEDQMQEKVEHTEEIEKIADEVYENERKRLEEDYEINKKFLEQKYADDKVYAEAKESIMRGTVEVAKGSFVDIYDAFVDFENRFGKGMGILGDIIKKDFLDQLALAQTAIERLDFVSANKLQKYDSDYQFEDGITMSESDYNKLIGYKATYGAAQAAGNKGGMDAARTGAQKIRDKYGVDSDKYSYDDLIKGNHKTIKFETGGQTEKTGLHWLDGLRNEPERVLTSEQTKAFNKLVYSDMTKIEEFVHTFDKINLSELIGSVARFSLSAPVGLPQGAGEQLVQIEKLINIEGNVTEEILPKIRDAGDELAKRLKKELKKIGSERVAF